MKALINGPVVLMILDGWGIAPPSHGNAVTLAKTPVMDRVYKKYPNTLLQASGKYVGLPKTQDGNSEAGHLNIGAGRTVIQDSLLISHEINTGQFFQNPVFIVAAEHARKYNSSVHLMGLLCNDQSAHAYPDHLLALLTFFRQKKVKKLYLHLFTDGRDSPPYVGVKLLYDIERILKPNEKIASIVGRFYAMDRIKKWERTEKAYNLMTRGEGLTAISAEAAILQAYNRGESDEFISPTVIIDANNKPLTLINSKDTVVCFNLRSDRARQLAKPFVQMDFEKKGGFVRQKRMHNLFFVAMTDFGPDLDHIFTAYRSRDLYATLPLVLHAKKQLYVAEREKYAHVTYFFNGGYSEPIGGEDRLMVPSPDIPSYDLKPEMSANEITDRVVDKINKNEYDFIMVNFANPDMVGHTGNLSAGIKAVEVVDQCVGEVLKALAKKNGVAIITADHGNVEEMINLKTGEVDTEHSSFPVPFILVGEQVASFKLKDKGVLGNVAPTVLQLLGIDKPQEMIADGLIIN